MTTPETSSKPLEVLLIGLGSIGSVYAFLLEKTGKARVTAVARSNYDLYNTSGVTLDTDGFGKIEGWKPYKVVKSQEDAFASGTIYDYVFLATKCLPDINPSSEILKPALDSKQIKSIALLQNGLDVERDLYDALKSRGLETTVSIVSMVAWIGIITNGDGTVVRWAGSGPAAGFTAMGLYPPAELIPAIEGGEAAVQTMADLLSEAGMKNTIQKRIDAIRYMKNVVNCTWSSLAGLTRTTPEHFAEITEESAESIKSLLREIVTAGYKSGLLYQGMPLLPYPIQLQDPESTVEAMYTKVIEQAVAQVNAGGHAHKMSLLIDVEQERPIELEVIVGSVIRVAKEQGIQTPLLQYTYALLQALQHSLRNKPTHT